MFEFTIREFSAWVAARCPIPYSRSGAGLLQVFVDGRGSIRRCLGSAPGKHHVVPEENEQFGQMLGKDLHEHKIQIYPQSGTHTLMPISVELVLVDSLLSEKGEETEEEEGEVAREGEKTGKRKEERKGRKEGESTIE